MSLARKEIVFFVNGKRVVASPSGVEMTLLDFLRRELLLTGTKRACGEGGCGACTVMVSKVVDDNLADDSSASNPERGSFPTPATHLRHFTLNACCTPVCYVDGAHVTTVEGIGTEAAPHPVQERIARFHGSQCGFCTPGFVVSTFAALHESCAPPTLGDMEDAVEGNLCRCTGYRSILDAAKSFAVNKDDCPNPPHELDVALGSPASMVMSTTRDKILAEAVGAVTSEKSPVTDSKTASLSPYATLSIAPAVVAEMERLCQDSVAIECQERRFSWLRPTNLADLLDLRRRFPSHIISAGQTELGVETVLALRPSGNDAVGQHVIDISRVQEMRDVALEGTSSDTSNAILRIGAATTLSELSKKLCHLLALQNGGTATADFSPPWALKKVLQWFGSRQVRNVATIGGSICTASPIGDLAPLLLVCRANLDVLDASNGVEQSRRVPIDAFFTDQYRKTSMSPTELLIAVRVPPTVPVDVTASCFEVVDVFKQSKRRSDDISTVTAAFRGKVVRVVVSTDADARLRDEWILEDFSSAFGGMAATPVRCTALDSAILQQRSLTSLPSLLAVSKDAIRSSFPLTHTTPGGKPGYRRTLALSFVYKFLSRIRAIIGLPVDPREIGCELTYMDRDPHCGISVGFQAYPRTPYGGGLCHANSAVGSDGRPIGQLVLSEAQKRTPVGDPVQHRSALAHATGEALYCDDMPSHPRQLYGAVIYSKQATGVISSIETSEALRVEGCVAVLTAQDVPLDRNRLGEVMQDEEMFRMSHVTAVGQPLGVVLARTPAAANEALRRVKVVLLTSTAPAAADSPADSAPPIVTISQALSSAPLVDSFDIAPDGFVPKVHRTHALSDGPLDIETALASSCRVVEGAMCMGGQDHFYFEPHTAMATLEEGVMVVYSSTQGPGIVQRAVCRVCALERSKVTVRVKRIGGGFGGKETRAAQLASICAFAAQYTRGSVRIALDRYVDMQMSGKRHPYRAAYRVGLNERNHIVAVHMTLWSNGGYSADITRETMNNSYFAATSTYKFENSKFEGIVCFTNTPTNTAFRGCGAPQGAMMCEVMMDHVAAVVGKDPTAFREEHLLRGEDATHFGVRVPWDPLHRCWAAVAHGAVAQRRAAEVEEFNARHRWVKRGIATTPCRMTVGFPPAFLNQARAIVSICLDGTVLVSHGGVEMGQGTHTKLAQIVAQALDVPLSLVRVTDTSTETVPNATQSAASSSSDLNGMAALSACEQLLQRIAPFRAAAGTGSKEVAAETPADRDAAWRSLVEAAYMESVNLTAVGSYKSDVTGYDVTKKLEPGESNAQRGTRPERYFVFGAARSEVEIDGLTGDMRIVRADLVFDAGMPLNPAIEIGQAEGAFLQGVGLVALEEQLVSGPGTSEWGKAHGLVLTQGPGTYKIPSSNDVPLDFRVAFLDNCPNTRAIHGSKSLGEAPLLCSLSVYFAIRNAIAAARRESGRAGTTIGASYFVTHSPLTPERIRLACLDEVLDGESDLRDSSLFC